MMIYERALRSGRWFARRRRYLPWVFGVVTVVALLMSTPFMLMRSTVWLTIPSVALVVGGFALRFAARRCNGSDPESWIAARGIYSVMRFPKQMGNYLIICGLTLYTGIDWYLLLVPVVGAILLHRIGMVEENSLVIKYGDTYQQWCRTTNAFTPILTSWEKSTRPLLLYRSFMAESQSIFMVVAAFTVINGLKYLLIDFSLHFDLFWLVLFVVSLGLALLGHLLRR